MVSNVGHSVLGQTFGRYEGLIRLAAGGMGQVLVARVRSERGVRRLVAIKTILSHLTDNELFLKMFVREAEIASRLHHPNIIPVLELGRTETEHFLVMEYFPSVPLNTVLRESLRQNVPMPYDVAAALIADAAGGLHAAHELTDDDGTPLHLVHRDATPSNLLVGADGSVKVTDFGVAKATGAQFENMTLSGDLRGKIGYLAPEQITGDGIDRRCDIFTLGIVLWECLTGRRLFGRKDNEIAALHALMHERIPDVREHAPDVPEALARIVERALERDRDKRFSSAAELRQALTTQLLPNTDAHRTAFAKTTIGEMLAERQRSIAAAVAELDSPDSIARRQAAAAHSTSEGEPNTRPSIDSSAAAASRSVRPSSTKSKWPVAAAVATIVTVGIAAVASMSQRRSSQLEAERTTLDRVVDRRAVAVAERSGVPETTESAHPSSEDVSADAADRSAEVASTPDADTALQVATTAVAESSSPDASMVVGRQGPSRGTRTRARSLTATPSQNGGAATNDATPSPSAERIEM
jgi:serine/threonine-protein kinase